MLVFLGIIINFLAVVEIATSRLISTGLITVEKLFESYPGDDVDREQQQPSRASEEAGSRHGITGLRWFFVYLAIFTAIVLYGLDTTIAVDNPSLCLRVFRQCYRAGLTWCRVYPGSRCDHPAAG